MILLLMVVVVPLIVAVIVAYLQLDLLKMPAEVCCTGFDGSSLASTAADASYCLRFFVKQLSSFHLAASIKCSLHSV